MVKKSTELGVKKLLLVAALPKAVTSDKSYNLLPSSFSHQGNDGIKTR